MRREPHPISGFIYEEVGGGVVRVSDPAAQAWGLFRWDGVWLEGQVTNADPHLLSFVGGPNLPEGRDVYWTLLPPVEDATRAVKTGSPARDASRARIVGPYVGDPGMQTNEGRRSASYIPQDYFLDNDRRPELVPPVYRRQSPMPGGPQRVNTARFISRSYHDREVEQLWKKTWQMACREDDIPDVGDIHVYTVAHLSWLIIRTSEREFKAHVNA